MACGAPELKEFTIPRVDAVTKQESEVKNDECYVTENKA